MKPLLILMTAAAVALAAACGAPPSKRGEDGSDSVADNEEYERGPHNGRLLRSGDFALEMTIFETGVPPEYRVYPYLGDAPVDPSAVDLSVTLGRLGGLKDTFAFAPEQDYLRGNGVVTEPHSFAVSVSARHGGEAYQWAYDSFEGRTDIADPVASASGVAVETAGSAQIEEKASVTGAVVLAPGATAEVRAVYPGAVTSVPVKAGDSVRRGQTLARIESSSSLQTYAVPAPIDGTVMDRRTNAGDVAGSDPLFVIADLSKLEANLHIFPKDAARVAAGQTVRLGIAGGEFNVEGKISRFLPVAGEGTQTRIAVVQVPADAGLVPGMRIVGEIVLGAEEVPLAVRESGLQSFRDFTVVYAKVDQTYEVRMLELGRRDGEFVEVLGGLRPGEVYVTENSFLIKADIEKSGASHDH